MEDYYMVEEIEGLRGARRSPLSHIFLRIFTRPCVLVFVCLVGCVLFWFALVCFVFVMVLWIFCTQLVAVHFMFPVVDPLCFALARRCRKVRIVWDVKCQLLTSPCCLVSLLRLHWFSRQGTGASHYSWTFASYPISKHQMVDWYAQRLSYWRSKQSWTRMTRLIV